MIVEGVISVWSSVPPPPIITSAPPPPPPPPLPHPPPHYNWALIQSRVIKNFHTGSADGHSTEFPSYMLNHCIGSTSVNMHWHYQSNLVINLLSPLPLPALIQSWVNTTRDFQSSLWRWWQRWVKVVTWYHSHYHHGDGEKEDSDNNDDDD